MIPLPPIPGLNAPDGAPGTEHWKAAYLGWLIATAGQAAGPLGDQVRALTTHALAETSLGQEVVKMAQGHLAAPPSTLETPQAEAIAQQVAGAIQQQAAASGHGNVAAAATVLSGAAEGAAAGAAGGPIGVGIGAGVGALTGLLSTQQGRDSVKDGARDVGHAASAVKRQIWGLFHAA